MIRIGELLAEIAAGLVGLAVAVGAFQGVLGGFLYVAEETEIYAGESGLMWWMTQVAHILGAFMVAEIVFTRVRGAVLNLLRNRRAFGGE